MFTAYLSQAEHDALMRYARRHDRNASQLFREWVRSIQKKLKAEEAKEGA